MVSKGLPRREGLKEILVFGADLFGAAALLALLDEMR